MTNAFNIISRHPAKLRALHLVMELSSAMGLHVNMAKCELFSMKGPQCTILGLHALHNKCAELLHLVFVAAVFILINSLFCLKRKCCKH